MEKKPVDEVAHLSNVVIGPVLSHCAESKVYECSFYDYPAVCKYRIPKAYRHSVLDQKLREQRTVREARALVRCRKHGVIAPIVYAVDREGCTIVMERIDGLIVRDVFNKEQKMDYTCGEAGFSLLVKLLLIGIGEIVGLLHNADIIHGDLTTSNFICKRKVLDEWLVVRDNFSPKSSFRENIVVLDFGLVMDKNSAEERAVDLYVLERAINSSHPFLENAASSLLMEGYHRTVDVQKGAATITRLEAVRARGRKRSMIG